MMQTLFPFELLQIHQISLLISTWYGSPS